MLRTAGLVLLLAAVAHADATLPQPKPGATRAAPGPRRNALWVDDRGREILVVGNTGLILRSTDGGASFERVPCRAVQVPGWCDAAADLVSAWRDEAGLYAASERGIALRSTDDGRSWVKTDRHAERWRPRTQAERGTARPGLSWRARAADPALPGYAATTYGEIYRARGVGVATRWERVTMVDEELSDLMVVPAGAYALSVSGRIVRLP